MTRVYSVKPVALVSGGRHELWHDCIPGVCASVLAMGPSRASRAVEFREYSVVESSIVWASRSLFRFCSAVSQVWSKLVSGIELPVSVATRVPCPCRVPCFRYGNILLFKTPIPYIYEYVYRTCLVKLQNSYYGVQCICLLYTHANRKANQPARSPALQPPSHEAKHSSSLARWSSLGIHLTVCGVPALPARRRRELVILVAAVLLVAQLFLYPGRDPRRRGAAPRSII